LNYEDRQRKYWCELLNKDIGLLRGILYKNPLYSPENKRNEKYIMYYSKKNINNATFLQKLSTFHRFTHQKIAHLKLKYADRESALICDNIDKAWYFALEANKKIPENKEEYEYREKCLNGAISCMGKAEVPLVSLFMMESFSENTLAKWSTSFAESLKYLFAIRKSDNERFKDLK